MPQCRRGSKRRDRLLDAMQGINFSIKAWYDLLIALGIAGATVALMADLKGVGIQNAHAFLVSLGVLLIGIGEWINHPLQTSIVPPNTYFMGSPAGKLTGDPRKNYALGVAFDIAGGALFVIGMWKIIGAA